MSNQSTLWSTSYIRMCLSSFFQFLTHYVLIVALPIFVLQSLKQGENYTGLALTFFQLGAVVFRPFAGKWIDSFPKKRVLFFALSFFCGVSFMYLGVQTSFILLLLLRFFHGAAFSVGTTATATMVALFSPASRKGEGVGYLSLFMSVAMVIGPFIGLTLINDYSAKLLFELCAVLGLAAFLSGNIPAASVRDFDNKHVAVNSRWWESFIAPEALPIAGCGVLLAIAYSGLLAYLPLYARKLGMTETARYFFMVYALVIIVTRPLIGKLFDRIGAKRIVYTAALFFFGGLLGLSRVTTPVELLLAGAVIGLGFGGLNPSFQTLAVMAVPSPKGGLATATYFLSLDIGVGIGSFVLGIVADSSGYSVMYDVCALLVVVIVLLFWRINYRKASQ